MTDIFRKEYKQLSEEQKKLMTHIKDEATNLWDLFDKATENKADGRMMALAKTNLEQAIMWSIKAIT